MSRSPVEVTAVFDIGKTNKKFILFDSEYSIVHRVQITIDQIPDDDGYPAEDLETLTDWIRAELREALQNQRFKITDLNFSTYGASLVHLNSKGEVVTPVYDYLKPYPEELKESFYAAHGGEKSFSLETASPPMGMLNSGLQLYWLKKKKPGLFSKISCSLHFPQYLSFLFTKKLAAELTSVGCHTAMWDYNQKDYHNWLREEGIEPLLPRIVPVSQKEMITYNSAEFHTGMGIHDSSAALAPYLIAMDKPFLLLSTGTWSITFNPFNRESLTFEELQRDCLCYMNIYGKQVKAARFFLGNEYRHQKDKLIRHFGISDGEDEVIPDPELLKKLISENSSGKKLKLETAHSSGPYPSGPGEKWNSDAFTSYNEAYHQLMMDLVSIQHECIRLVEGSGEIDQAIVTGGFGNNDFFLKLLAARLPDKKIYSAAMPHATALGGALVMRQSNNGSDNLHSLLSLVEYKGIDDTGMESYKWQ